MVFDLGGGTFDVSLLAPREGRLVVLGHDGDNKLGGKDFDWKLAEFVSSRLVQEFGEHGLNRGNPAARRALAKLKLRAEDAKKQLSVREIASVDVSDLGAGLEDINGTIDITRIEYERLIAPDVEKAVAICSRLLNSNRLVPSAVETIILVGGPTLTPYVRAAVENSFGAPPKVKIDPMTVVARGAALFAATQRVPGTATVTTKGKINLVLAYSPVSEDTEAEVGISISPAP